MSFSVEAAIDSYVAANASVREPDGMMHPSSISGCQRKAIYELRGVSHSDPRSPKQNRILYIGTAFHEIVQAAVKATPLVAEVHTEVRILVPELNLTGSADQLLVFEDGTAETQEFKTIKEWAFKKLTEPKDDHLEQVKAYLFALRSFGGVSDDGVVIPPLGDRLRGARFTYIEKQTFDVKEFLVEWNPAWETEIRARLDNLERFVADPESLPSRLPMSDKGKKSWMCDWGWGRCEYFTRCWEQDGEGTLADPDEF